MKTKILLLGAPGSGKGTQAKYLAGKYNFLHIAMGDILRQEVQDKTPLGLEAKSFMDKGALVPDEVVNNIVVNKLKSLERSPFILDGFPRTIPQAEFLEKNAIAFDCVIYFKISLESVLDRMSGRLTCPKCGASFHIKYNPPKKEGICDLCGGPLIVRDDDKPETVKRRFETYLKQTQPLLDFYQKKGIVFEVDAEQNIDDIQKMLIGVVDRK
ncbi:MAG: adenylate kinase [Candidatus Margulisbacteria bacterium]|nr:adenylate kinase [Candidatus Margulisiibacteriota bacterium]